MPIVLGEAPSTPRWNHYVLFVLWLLQFLLLGFLEYVNLVSLAFMGGWAGVGGKPKAGEPLYDISFPLAIVYTLSVNTN
jgi:hypothetical protein